MAFIDFENPNVDKLLDETRKKFDKHYQVILTMANEILETSGKKDKGNFRSIFSAPLIDPANRQQCLLAICVQNAFHHKNNLRVDAVSDGSYIEITSSKCAHDYLTSILSKSLLKKLKSFESDLCKSL